MVEQGDGECSITVFKKMEKPESKPEYRYYNDQFAQNEDAVDTISAKELNSFVQKLPDGYRVVFNLYVMEGYKHREIAEMLSISENTSKSQLLKAKKMLRSQLEKVLEY